MNKVSSSIKEAAGFVKEEVGEVIDNDEMAQEGRNLRNEGRLEKGEKPKLTKPGTGHPEDPEDTDTKF